MTLDKLKLLPEYDDHEFITFLYSKKTGLEGYIALHRGNHKIPSFGATRIWSYANSTDALLDALRLSKTMSYKAALAGLRCGGAKAVLIANSQISSRKDYLESYARKLNILSGHFITGADVGISREDVILMRRYSPYLVGIEVDPVRFTGLGIYLSLKACLKEVYGKEDINGRSFAIQGVGKVGQELLKFIYPAAQEIYIADIDKHTLRDVKDRYPKVKILEAHEIYGAKVDVFSPCALGGSLNNKTVNNLKCAIVVGGANNQLENENIAEMLHSRGTLYAPDYVVNAGGLISVYDEYKNGNNRIRRVEKKIRRIKITLREILAESKEKKVSPLYVANKKAERFFNSL